jgi:chitinase
MSQTAAGGRMMRRFSTFVFAVALVIASTTAVAAKPPESGPPGQLDRSDPQIVGYFIQWGIYDRQFYVKDLVDNGSAEKLTVINYAFGNVAPNDDGDIECQSFDSWADYGALMSEENSVDGAADVWGAPLRGNFNQLRKLKAEYPDLRVNISLGGWTGSKWFSDGALTPESRATLVKSCIDLFLRGNLPIDLAAESGGPGSGAGVFDGIDLDWEWPGSAGNTGNTFRPEDKQNFTALVEEFREQLDDYGQDVGKDFQLTAFLPADPGKIAAGFEVSDLMESFDFATFQGYDLAGSWDPSTNHQSKLYAPKGDPLAQWSVDVTAQTLLAEGAPASKLVMGAPFYGRGWTGVTNDNHGLYQPATGPATGTWEAGVDDYKVLATRIDEGFPRYWDGKAKVPWLFDGTTFWTYDDPVSLKHKAQYVRLNGLGGLMFWELSGDTSDGELISAIEEGLTQRGPR